MKRALSTQERQTLLKVIKDDPVAWGETYFYVEDPCDIETGELLPPGPIRLFPHQQRIIRAALQRNRDGAFRWKTIIYSAVKKSGKTRTAAMMAAWLAATQGPYAEIYLIANDGKQSNDRLLKAVEKAVTLSPLLDWKIKRGRVELEDQSFLEAIPVDPKGESGANPVCSCWCLDRETEVLTSEGWLDCNTIHDDCQVATLSPEGAFEWQQPYGTYKSHYQGKMYGVDLKRVNMLVTPEHRVYGKFFSNYTKLESAEWGLLPAKEVASNFYMKVKAAPDSWEGHIPFEEFILPSTARKPDKKIELALWVRFLAWYLAEGCIHYDQRRRTVYPETGAPDGIILGQSDKKPENCAEIKQLFIDMGFSPKRRIEDAFEVWDVRLAQYCNQFGKAHQKFVPKWVRELPTSYLRIFLQAYRRGDGWDHGTGFDIGTVSVLMVDHLIEIGQKCGYYVNYTGFEDDRSQYLQYKIRFRSSYPTIKKQAWYTEDYDGMVFCPSTPNGIILVRRRGRVYWTGNSELWGFGSSIQNKTRLWTEMTVSPVRRGKSIRIVESYAGYVGESQVLEGLYENTVRQGRKHPNFPDLPVYINEAAGIFCYWDHIPRMPWQTEEYYRHEAAVLPANEFERIHRNRWVSSTEDYIDEVLWNKCQEQITPAHPHEAWIIALDGSVNHDSFAIVGVTRHPDTERRDDIAVRFVHVIEPDRGRKIDQEAEVVPILERLCNEHYVVSIPYDPYQLHKLATDLERDGMAHFSEFSQGGKRLTADSQLRRMIISRQIAHQGHPVLTEHIARNAAAKVDGTEHQVRIVKKSESMRVDAAVALSMATAECLRLNLE